MFLGFFVLKVVRMQGDSFIFGFSNEWTFFQKQHPKFVEALDSLADTGQKTIKRLFVPNTPAEELIFFSGVLVLEEFAELWVLAGNGCGVGALKILRGMYERTVTAAYISKFPEEASRFWIFGAIAYRRVLNNVREIYGLEQLKEILGADHFDEAEKNYQEVRHDFEETLCRRCEIFRVAFSWSQFDLATMAKKAGYGLAQCYWGAYSIPTQQAHSTVLAITSRLKVEADGSRYFDRSAEYPSAALAASMGHVVLLKMLRIQDSFFSLGLAAEIAQREAECKDAWPGIECDFGMGM
jgi:hypothetical protein